jgi:putative ABC transport system ATP-binding protein
MFIRFNGVSKVYGEGASAYRALNNIDFEIGKGNISAILGPSGSGKSTLLNIMGGIDRVSEGQVTIDGQEISSLNDSKLTDYRKDKVGFVFQFYNLIPNLTVEENIEVASNISSSPMDIYTILEAVGMKEFKRRFPKELSGGQQQRVSIARALVKNPPILLCDEPTGALDYNTSKDILGLMEDINKKFNTTIIIITHNNSIAQMAHRVIKLRSGEITENIVNNEVLGAERIEW